MALGILSEVCSPCPPFSRLPPVVLVHWIHQDAEESTPGVTELELPVTGLLAQVTQHTFLQPLLCSNYYSAPSRHCSEQRKQQEAMLSKLMF